MAHGRFSFQDFYTSRIRRIFPALILVLGITLVIGWFILLSGEFKNLGINAAAAAVFSANLLQWRQVGYFDPTADVKPLLHLWSLGVEEQFYLAWPLLLLLLWRSQKILVPLLVGLIVLFSANALLVYGYPTAVFYCPLARIWELLIGALLSYIGLFRVDLGAIQRLIRLLNSIVRAGKFEPNNLIEQRVFDLIVRLKLARHNRLSIAEGPR